MRRSARDYDESDVRVRPNRRGSRPRTKDRPRHEDAITARVVSVDRGRWHTVVAPGTDEERTVIAMRARELGRSPVVPGDLVGLVGDTSGRDGSLARIVRIRERSSFLRRSADDDDATERPLVANVDLMVMVTAVADPEPRGGMIDRCLVAAYVAGVDTLLVLTKADLRSPEQFLRTYAPLGLQHVVTAVEPHEGGDRPESGVDADGPGAEGSADGGIVGLQELRRRLAGHVSVLVGHSGVGKSTLLNALVPGTDRATGVVNDVTGRGRHTSTSAVALELPAGGWIIDTPGIRSFGLAHVEIDDFVSVFPDIADAAAEFCPRGCAHASAADGCALDEWATTADQQARVASIRRLLATRADNESWQ